jgi:glycosyltransferase involved in cell wall biosynthesis
VNPVPILFSVIIPAFNAERFIEDTLLSVRRQSIENWEAIVVDDGSSDDTPRVVRRMASSDRRIRIVAGQHVGVSAARNLGMSLARGRYLALLDADDLWCAEKLEAHLRHLETQPEVGVSFSQVRFMSFGGEPGNTCSRVPAGPVPAWRLLYDNPATTCSTLVIRRSLLDRIGGFDESMSYAEDLEWLLRAALLGGATIAGLQRPLVLYRTNESGLSSRLERMQQGWETMIERARVHAPALVAQHEHRARARHLRYLARRALRLRLPPDTGWQLIRAALAADRMLLLRDPLRAGLTLAASAARRFAPALATKN